MPNAATLNGIPGLGRGTKDPGQRCMPARYLARYLARKRVSLAIVTPDAHTGSMALRINKQALAGMIAATREAGVNEACGLLLGTDTHIEQAIPAANVAPSPACHFEIDPATLIAAHRAARDGSGSQVVGYFHSHPNGLERPSATDAQSAARDGRVWVIVARGAITCWCDGPDGFEPLSYAVTEG